MGDTSIEAQLERLAAVAYLGDQTGRFYSQTEDRYSEKERSEHRPRRCLDIPFAHWLYCKHSIRAVDRQIPLVTLAMLTGIHALPHIQ